MDYFAQYPALWWLGAGFVFLIAEMLTGTLFFFFMCIGAFLVGLLTAMSGISSSVQLLCFAVAAVAAVAAWTRFRPNPKDKLEQRAGAEGLNNRLAGFIGRDAVLEEPIHKGHGRIRLDDSYWSVVGEDAPAGTQVRIIAVEGMILRVEPDWRAGIGL
ncbi:MAG: NfeD family protein [bacterium]|nr:NfeD family protein [bacterium]